MTTLAHCLDRTLLLMRDEFGDAVEDDILLAALTSTSVALIADATNLASHSAQTALITAALLMARSGHEIYLVAPGVQILYPQPPLQPGTIVDELVKVGKDILPGIEFKVGEPEREVDLAIAFGSTRLDVDARRKLRVNADAWAGLLLPEDQSIRWHEVLWPFGGLVAGGLAAGEAFKLAMMELLPRALNPESTALLFAPTTEREFRLAPVDSPRCTDLGQLDFVSGGAIANSTLYCLARIPEVRGVGKIIEPDFSDHTNLNRNMFLLRTRCGASKSQDLSDLMPDRLRFESVVQRYDLDFAVNSAPLARTVVIGVDDIPTRWVVQRANPELLVVGATTHWSAMASFHSVGLGCAECLHNRNDIVEGPIRTTACVSFWAGLLSAAYVARRAAGEIITAQEQQVFLTPFRPETPFIAAVAKRKDCLSCRQMPHYRPIVAA
ncbi:hypothetical protein ABIB73_004288 [Bradyrhizobium sp. F1.4.3]|uniref:hypothetical protein n=1 Tax=Bradyrhizobium sp. F1.4.3 TaxID=3156356 RepID=UPI0033918264